MNELFKNRKLVIATMHKKEKVIKPILEEKLGVKCFTINNIDTDKFGTFTRDIKRFGSMIDASRAKLKLAMDISGCDIGVASEGSFGSHYGIPIINSNLEIILLIDKKNDIEIIGKYISINTNLDGNYINNLNEAIDFCKKISFPNHGLIIRPWKNINLFIKKDIDNEEKLKNYVSKLLKIPFIKKIFIETDMRANKNPTRMKNIELAMRDLIKNIKCKCPKCKTPGFYIKEKVGGLLCGECLNLTNKPTNDVYYCNKCNFSKKVKIKYNLEYASPSECGYCNP